MVTRSGEVAFENCGEGAKRKILSYTDGLMMVEVTFEAGAVGALHTHFQEQISYIAQGSFEFELAGKKERLKRGDSVYIPSNEEHGLVALETPSVIVDVFTPKRDDFLKK